MRIACIDNMNHSMFVLCRHLNDCGLDAELLLTGAEKPQFHPQKDAGYERWRHRIHTLHWDPRQFFVTPGRQILADVAPYDVLIGCGYVPAFLHKAGRTLDLFVPYASDLFELPFPSFQPAMPHPLLRYLYQQTLAPFQRAGLKSCRYLLNTQPTANMDTALRRLGHPNVETIPLLYTHGPDFLHALKESSGEFGARVKQLRQDNELLIVNYGRQVWRTRSDRGESNKGTDILIRGYAQFLQRHAEIRSTLVMFDHGMDAPASRQLSQELGIGERLTWLSTIGRGPLLHLTQTADILCDQFVLGMVGTTAWEAVALGKPLLAHLDEALYRQRFGLTSFTNARHLQARTPEEVAAQLDRYVREPEGVKEQALNMQRWFEERMIRDVRDRYLSMIRQAYAASLAEPGHLHR